MTNKPKAKGTTWETQVVRWLVDRGFPARRLAEGGNKDEGDVETTIYGTRWVVEAKARANLSPQTALAKARSKAAGSPVMLIWKRNTRKPGNSRATPVAGEPVTVLLSQDDLGRLLETANRAGWEDGKEYGFTHKRGQDDG